MWLKIASQAGHRKITLDRDGQDYIITHNEGKVRLTRYEMEQIIEWLEQERFLDNGGGYGVCTRV